jgi:spore maturation protein A
MLNKIWFWMFVVAVGVALGKGFYRAATAEKASGAERVAALSEAGKQITDGSFEAARTAVELCLKMIGGFALFLGIMRIAQDAGLVQGLANAMRPLLRRLFPDVPDGHPASGAILMNMAANMLGLGNAATPMGLKAMQELQTLNPRGDTATNAMAMFLAINTSAVTIFPTSIIVLRAAAGSENPAAPIFAGLCATAASTAAAILAVRWLQPRYPLDPPASIPSTGGDREAAPEDE